MNDKHMKETIYLVKQEIAKKTERTHISFWEFLKMQIRFVGWRIWVVQVIAVGVICLCMTSFFGKYYMENPRYLLRMLMILAIVVLMTAIPFSYRSIRYCMQEVEAVTYISSVRLLLARLFIVAIGDAVLLGSIYILAITNSVVSKMLVFFCLAIPFLMVGNGCLFMMRHLRPKQYLQGSMGLCIGMIGLLLYKGLWMQDVFQNGWYGLLISSLLTILCIYQIWNLQDSSYTELQIL